MIPIIIMAKAAALKKTKLNPQKNLSADLAWMIPILAKVSGMGLKTRKRQNPGKRPPFKTRPTMPLVDCERMFSAASM